MFEVSSNQVFKLHQPSKLLKRSWAGESVIYKVDARETHQLSVPCAYVLGLLEHSPASTQSLFDALQVQMQDLEVDEVESQLAQILETLCKLDVIEAIEDAS